MIVKVTLAAAAATAALANQAASPTLECRLKVGVAIGCLGNENRGAPNAASMFTTYGLDTKRISLPATKAYLNRYDCIYVAEGKGGIGFHMAGKLYFDEPDGEVAVVFGTADIDPHKRFMWIAEPYLTGPCPRLRPISPPEPERTPD